VIEIYTVNDYENHLATIPTSIHTSENIYGEIGKEVHVPCPLAITGSTFSMPSENTYKNIRLQS
jgi:hypothetical protein